MLEPRRIGTPPGVPAVATLALAVVLAVLLEAHAAAQPVPPKPEAPVFPLAPLWTATLDSAPALPPAYDTTHAYLVLKPDPDRGFASARLIAVSLGDGSLKWTHDIPAADALAVGAAGVFTCAGPLVQAFGAADGAPRWQLPLGAPLSAPLHLADGRLVATTQASDVTAVRTLDGSKLWQRHLPSPATGEPATSGDGLYLPLTDNRVIRLKPDTGAITWTVRILSQPTTVLALEDRVFVGTREDWFYALRPHDGKVLWRVRVGAGVVGAPAVDRSAVYFLALDNLLRALYREGGSLDWRQMLVRRERFGPLLAGGLLLVSGFSPTLQAYDAVTGKPAGSFDAPRDLAGPVHLVPGLLARDFLAIVLTGEGQLMALRTQSLQPEAFALSPRVYLTNGFPFWHWW